MLFSFQRPSASRALLRSASGKKKPLRRRGPLAAPRVAAIGQSTLRLFELRSFQRLLGQPASIARLSAPQAPAAHRGAFSEAAGQYSTPSPGRCGYVADPNAPELAPADLQDGARRGGRPRCRGRPRPAARRRGAPRPGPAAGGPRCGRCRSASASSAGRWTLPLSTRPAATARPPRSPRAAGAPCGPGRSARSAPAAASAPWKRSTIAPRRAPALPPPAGALGSSSSPSSSS